MNNVRKQIAARLKYEFGRRNLSVSNVAQESGVAEGVVSAYLEGKKEIDINELRKICAPFEINSTRLLFSRDYPKVKLSFRNTTKGVQNLAAVVEDIFLLLQQSIPAYRGPSFNRKLLGSQEKTDLISEAATLAKDIRRKFLSPQDFLKNYSIPVIAINPQGYNFDAFLVRNDQKIIICVNKSTAPQRIQFSLAHEISHIIFDGNIEVPIDTFVPNFYWKKWLTRNESPEFFAYKFAQFYLIPFEEIHSLAYSWPNLDLEIAQQLVENGGTTKEVLANAIYDYLLVNPHTCNAHDDYYYTPSGDQFQRMDWEEGNDQQHHCIESGQVNFQSINSIVSCLKASSKSGTVYEYLQYSTSFLYSILEKEKQNLSEEIFDEIRGILSGGAI
ncbi:MAG: ImmA/IrrE family metallo-endopeptidase [Deltaproteobacteria bacterium]|nr:ImmA/IrrE family metallo-endopeptidase [Deltaproteobacteria bacterium]